jgi:hypothetical protein
LFMYFLLNPFLFSFFLFIIVFFPYIHTSLLFAVHLDFCFFAGFYSQLYFAADYFIVLFSLVISPFYNFLFPAFLSLFLYFTISCFILSSFLSSHTYKSI